MYILKKAINSDLAQATCEDILSIVIPAYNEEKRLSATLARITETNFKHYLEILIVCDGCTDNTEKIAQEFSEKLPLKVISYPDNRGKGHAVRKGVLAAKGQIIGFMDADGSTPPAELSRLAELFMKQNTDIVIGSRRARGSKVQRQPFIRHLLGSFFSCITRTILLLPYKDTQCGCKLFNRRCALELFDGIHSDGFDFDIEILYQAHHRGMRISEVGIEWNDTPGSKVDPTRDGLHMLWTVLQIRLSHLTNWNQTQPTEISRAEEL